MDHAILHPSAENQVSLPTSCKTSSKVEGPSMIWPLHTRVAFVAYRVSYVKSELRFPEFPLLQTPGVQGTWRGFAGGL